MKRKRIQVRPKTTRRVRAADGIIMPWPRGAVVIDGVRPTVFTPETVVIVADSLIVRRRIAAGDMVEVDEVPAPKLASRPTTVKPNKKEE